MMIYYVLSLAFALIAFLCLIHLSQVVDELNRELDNAKKEQKLLDSIIKTQDESIEKLTVLIRVKNNEIAWYVNATNSEAKAK